MEPRQRVMIEQVCHLTAFYAGVTLEYAINNAINPSWLRFSVNVVPNYHEFATFSFILNLIHMVKKCTKMNAVLI